VGPIKPAQPWVSRDRDTNKSQLSNYPSNTRMFSGFLQHGTLNMWHMGAYLYMPNSISTQSLQDLNIFPNLICCMLLIVHIWFCNYMVYTRMKKIHTVVLMWIPFWSRG
jgi:hypothetical protein